MNAAKSEAEDVIAQFRAEQETKYQLAHSQQETKSGSEGAERSAKTASEITSMKYAPTAFLFE